MTSSMIEISADLAVRSCRALITCVDELGALHMIKYGNVLDTQHPVIRQKMEQDDRVKNDALGVLLELHEFLSESGHDPTAKIDKRNPAKKGADE